MAVFTKNQRIIGESISISLIILSVIQICTQPQLNPTTQLYLRILTFIFFGGAVHVAFTFFIMLSLPECKRWFVKQNSQVSIVKKLIFITLIFSAGSIVFLFYNNHSSSIGLILLNILWLVYPTYHTFRQIYGILVLYNQDIVVSQKEKNVEKKIFNFLMVILCIHTITLVIFQAHLLSQQEYQKLNWLLSIVFCLPAFFLFKNKTDRKAKNFYVVRIFLYPLSFHSFFALLATGALHGLEYFFITKKMVLNSEQKFKSSNNIPAFLSFFSIFVLYILSSSFGILGIYTGGHAPQSAWYGFVNFAGLLVAFIHYYMDGLIFRMKDPATREIIAPLLM